MRKATGGRMPSDGIRGDEHAAVARSDCRMSPVAGVMRVRGRGRDPARAGRSRAPSLVTGADPRSGGLHSTPEDARPWFTGAHVRNPLLPSRRHLARGAIAVAATAALHAHDGVSTCPAIR